MPVECSAMGRLAELAQEGTGHGLNQVVLPVEAKCRGIPAPKRLAELC
jgi:hypothetical protein